MDVIIAGGGIAGLTLAFWLERRGHAPVVVEQGPGLRAGGYLLDFFGPGYAVAEQMGLLPALARQHDPVRALRFIDATGRQRFALDIPDLRHRVFADRHLNVTRGELEEALYAAVRERVAVRFGTSVAAIAQDGVRVVATFTDGTTGTYDLLVGADGLHSHIRALAFGPEARFLRPLGYDVAALTLDRPPPQTGRDAWMLTAPGRQVTLFPLRDGGAAALFVHRAPSPGAAADPRAVLRRAYGDLGWVVPDLLAAVATAPALYYDAVAQTVVPLWSAGRVALVGDAAGCVSLLAGQGASLAMAGAHALAEALDGGGADVPGALARYEARVRPTVDREQAGGRRMARWFVPATRGGVVARDLVTRVSMHPLLTPLARRQVGGGRAALL